MARRQRSNQRMGRGLMQMWYFKARTFRVTGGTRVIWDRLLLEISFSYAACRAKVLMGALVEGSRTF
jgi:hypothetical protein